MVEAGGVQGEPLRSRRASLSVCQASLSALASDALSRELCKGTTLHGDCDAGVERRLLRRLVGAHRELRRIDVAVPT